MWRKSNGITCEKPFVSDNPHLPSVFYDHDIIQPVTLSAFVLVIIIMMEIQPHVKKVQQAPPLPPRPDGNIPTEGIERTEWVT
jgi:hypothetical protein